MKVLIDGRSINRTGIGTYTRMLIYGLIQKNVDLVIMGRKEDLFQYHGVKIVNISNSIYSFGEQVFTLFGEIASKGVDLVHYTNYNKSVISIRPFVVTIHDLIQFKFEYGNSLKRKIGKVLLEQVVNSASKVICVSRSTSEDLVEMFPYIDRSKVEVVYNPAVNPLQKNVEYIDVKAKYGIPRYILSIGNRKPHKNLGLLIKGFEEIFKDFQDIYLVLIAKRFEENDYVDRILRDTPVKDRIFVFENLPYDEIVSFYRYAEVTVLPSLYEGFGLVPFESISNGTLPLVSDIKVMRELFFDESEIFFDPNDHVSLAEKLRKFLLSPEEKIKILSRLTRYLDIYSFDRFVDGTLNVYRSCLQV